MDFRIDRFIDNNHYDSRSYDSLEALINGELYSLDFDELVYIPDEALESQTFGKTEIADFTWFLVKQQDIFAQHRMILNKKGAKFAFFCTPETGRMLDTDGGGML